jgi:hypothetical protein
MSSFTLHLPAKLVQASTLQGCTLALMLRPALQHLISYITFPSSYFAAGQNPPGVYPSPDGADVAAPISLFEWLLNFYEEARESKVRPAPAPCFT